MGALVTRGPTRTLRQPGRRACSGPIGLATANQETNSPDRRLRWSGLSLAGGRCWVRTRDLFVPSILKSSTSVSGRSSERTPMPQRPTASRRVHLRCQACSQASDRHRDIPEAPDHTGATWIPQNSAHSWARWVQRCRLGWEGRAPRCEPLRPQLAAPRRPVSRGKRSRNSTGTRQPPSRADCRLASRGFLDRGPQRRAPWSARNWQSRPGHRSGHRCGRPPPPRYVQDRDPLVTRLTGAHRRRTAPGRAG